MTINRFYNLLLTVLMLAFVTACNDDDDMKDSTAPSLTLNALSKTDFENGETLTVSGTVSDDTQLDKVSLQVEGPDGTEITDWNQQKIFEGTSGSFSFDLPFPSDGAPGTYILTVSLLDKAGNDADEQLSIHLSEPDLSKPSVAFTGPSTTEYQAGDALTFTITVQDNRLVDSLSFSLLNPEGVEAHQTTFQIDSAGNTLELPYTFPTDAMPGAYTAKAVATDAAGNDSTTTITITLVNPDNINPTVTFTAPENNSFEAGSTVSFAGTVSDNQEVDKLTFSLFAPDGAGLMEEVMEENAASIDFSFSYNIPSDATPGTYTARVEGVDIEGNTAAATKEIEVVEPSIILTFTVSSLPANTPAGEGIYISGEFAAGVWVAPGTDEAFRLTDNGDGTYSISLEAAATTETEGILQYKFGRQGGWGTAEVAADCAGINNRTVASDGSVTEVSGLSVAAWGDLCQPDAGTNVTFTITNIPANTPAGDDIYIAGEFADGIWVEPGTNQAFKLTNNGDGTYSISLAGAAGDDGIIEYKFFRQGGWATGEVSASCEGVSNRTLDVTNTTEATGIEIPAWEDVCGQ